ncbi:acetyl/propionyl/methylcrotonyl-CoA carboxylase subunit alpha [Salaquimonas pukyongi]|uniref:acetyl/propionyl/methylcrotonyl-CoA carboxylase subunit alpha n=1 Tax=Salaquimonas pukyongi TaxID=2712698 RepID=UPI00096B7961|nr:acetyl/propionyl/methylcrotonyl-CoA carboxylase subunit alpha [Salaquimonas pukyongi]
MFSKILIANRGEIACRVIHTASRMGVETVAIYSDADGEHGPALHVRMADEAVPIGPRDEKTGREPYLLADRIINAALATGAEAIHPGYGFLSENPDFVEAVEKAGLVFIGPSARSIRAMGLKDAAKALMEKAGVPVVPGYHGERQEPEFLAGEADKIGYPVLIKARAGGGGKGMRKVDDPKDFAASLEGAQREGEASFGDGRVLIEKYIAAPRHIEVQVFGDNHGNVVHLYERDCSLQRRHQKVIEEAPAPGMTQEMRAAMTSAAVTAAKAIDYSGAGTIEFIVDGSKGLKPDGFWFMEMNTRLQVEHPVTEEVTGVDLVEWQLRAAAGELLPLEQKDIQLEGHAFEARLYAEDAAKGFLPAIGTLHHLSFANNARIETGVEQGSVISPFYDPMIAKIISKGNNRSDALQMLHAALRHTQVAGTVTNKAFLSALCLHEELSKGKVDTGLIERDLETLVPPSGNDEQAIVSAALFLAMQPAAGAPDEPFDALGAFSLWGQRTEIIHLEWNGERLAMALETEDGIAWSCRNLDVASGAAWQAKLLFADLPANRMQIIFDGKEIAPGFAKLPGHLAVFLGDETYEFTLPDLLEATKGEEAGADAIIAPMPGLVKKLSAKPGQKIARDDPLLVLEAMKMEHVLSAPRDGILAAVNVTEGDQVVDGTVLISLKAEDGEK